MSDSDAAADAGGPWGDPRIDEFYLAATRMLESVRPWLAAGLAEHLAHADGAPGDCRLCAALDAVTAPVEQLLRDVAAGTAELGTLILEELMRLLDEIFGRITLTMDQIRERYAAREPAAPEPTAPEAASDEAAPDAPDSAAASDPLEAPAPAPGPAARGRGYVPIDVSFGTDAGPAPAREEEP